MSVPSQEKKGEKAVKIKKELRKEPRKHFEGPIFYATDDQLYEGEVKNYSVSGIFVKTRGNFFVGQWLNLALPFSKENNSKRLGSVVWKNIEGIGVELKLEDKL